MFSSAYLLHNLRSLITLNPSQRPWHHAMLVALCCAIPAMIGAALGAFQSGLMACMGAMAVMYMPASSLPGRMVTLQVVAFGMATSVALGLLGAWHPLLSAITLALAAFLISLICRYFAVPPPGNFFFIMLAAVATVIPFSLHDIPQRVGLIMLGSMSSCLLVLGYSLLFPVLTTTPATLRKVSSAQVKHMTREALITGILIGGSYWVAHLLNLHNPYWVPISCAAILQGSTLRLVWMRKVQRIIGTAIGILFASLLFQIPMGPWALSFAIIILSIIIESLILRNYGLAVIFVTPLTVIFAGVANTGLAHDELVLIRLIDISLGSAIGALGGWWMHRHQSLS